MNAARRKATCKILELLETQKVDLESLRDEEQEYYDNMPESFQNGEKGEQAQAAIDHYETAISGIDDAISEMQEIAN